MVGFFVAPSRPLVSSEMLDGIAGLTGAWSMSRRILTAYAGSFYTDAGGGAISELLDQSGNSRNLTQGTGGNRPSATTAGSKSRACASFDGTNDILTGTTVSNFIGAANGYIAVSALVDAVDTNNTTAAQGYLNDAIFADDGANLGMMLRNGGGSAFNVLAQSFDGGGSDDTASVSISLATVYVFEWRHEGGTLYLRVNGGSEQSVASGNTVVTGALQVGRNYNGANKFDGKVFEMVTFSTVPALATRDAIVANMLSWAQ